MKQQVNPFVLIGVGVVAAVLLVIFAVYSLSPHPPQATIPSADMQNEGAVKRRNVMKKYGNQVPAAAPAASTGPSSGRTGE